MFISLFVCSEKLKKSEVSIENWERLLASDVKHCQDTPSDQLSHLLMLEVKQNRLSWNTDACRTLEDATSTVPSTDKDDEINHLPPSEPEIIND
ncbi:hypothetical protein ACF0H5_014901 [Mactra antiquata]